MGKKWLCFFRQTSYVNISETVYPIYLKIKVQRVPTSHSSHINFWVNRITRFRDIDVGSWPKKTTKKTKFFGPPFIYIYIQHVPSPKESNLTTWQPDNPTTWHFWALTWKQKLFSMIITIMIRGNSDLSYGLFCRKVCSGALPPTHPYRRKLRKEPFDRFLALCHVSLKQQLKCSTVHVCL